MRNNQPESGSSRVPGKRSRLLYLFAGSLICINSQWPATAGASETLAQAWQIAGQRDHSVLAAQYREQAAAAQVQAAQAYASPQVNLEAAYLRTQVEPAAKISLPGLPMLAHASLPFAQDAAGAANLNLSLPLYTAGKISHGVAAAEAGRQATQAQSRVTLADMRMAVAQAYVAVLRARQAKNVADSHVLAMQNHRRDVGELAQRGYAAKHDELAVEVALAQALQWQLQADHAVQLSLAAYNRWLGRSAEAPADLAEPEVSPLQTQHDLAALIQQAWQARPELQGLQQQTNSLREQAASIQAADKPQLGVSAGYAKLENRYLAQDKAWYAALVMKWNLFDGGLTRQQATQMQAQAAAVEQLAQDSREKISLQVREAWLAQDEAQARLRLSASAKQQAEQVLQLARERYRNGLAPNSEVLDAESRRLQALSNHDQGRYDLMLARLRLRYASGQLALADLQP